jgi:hypothetical protein
MRGKIFGRFFPRTLSSLAVAAVLIAVPLPIRAFADEPSPSGDEQKQSEQDRCKFLMDKVSAIILSLNPEGKITFLKSLWRRLFRIFGQGDQRQTDARHTDTRYGV